MLKPRVLTECVPNVDRALNNFVSEKDTKLTARSTARQDVADGQDVLNASHILSLREILNWGQFANCKGKMKLFFAPKAERPQARQRREARHKNCVRLVRCKKGAKSSPARIMSMAFGVAKAKSSATSLGSRWPHPSGFAPDICAKQHQIISRLSNAKFDVAGVS